MTVVRLNRRMVLEEASRSPDGAGGYTETWVALGTLWARVEARAGNEQFANGATWSTVTYRITVRASEVGAPSRPRPDQRLRSGARVFRILAVAEADPEGRYLTCFAEEEVPA